MATVPNLSARDYSLRAGAVETMLRNRFGDVVVGDLNGRTTYRVMGVDVVVRLDGDLVLDSARGSRFLTRIGDLLDAVAGLVDWPRV
jgi:hypothetical protein